ncbi:phosphohydrolase [Ameyamaea chiangmaiensis NBRC 103196]|uniref:Nudix hydrolase domain-containing protein n=1 Tax=Ameyamaea chiangmaiensis TaxID=442969 RepID=A0A850P419_9PROT|nr:hypothetical protein [Ameyamaea chiangmaiensis]MBS4074047.1 hypothetical protein [Ameyamaea chiangmaiensis]NVN39397.1 hypothetical protein [Ameyamaea chiangmaiensis]GBQ67447.1 phosphohydrolase [Ameyamaea chiangmaiensis NBRC 103196]
MPDDADWPVYSLAHDVRVEVGRRDAPPLAPEVEARVDALWDAARDARPTLFNGRVFSADAIAPDLITGHWTEFRRVFAQMRDPGLVGALNLRPLAVVGVLQAPEGIVVGQRAADAIYQPGRWQACPAGSVESRDGDDTVDLHAQLLAEADEELGLDATAVRVGRPLVGVEHPGTRIVDLAFMLHTALPIPEIEARWKARANREYAALRALVPTSDQHATLTPPTQRFLAALRVVAQGG